VLLIPCWGHFMCPFAITGLEFKYLRINFLLMPGHPFKNPRLVAFNRVEIFGLHKDWCANLTALALVITECVNIARVGWTVGWGARPIQRPGRDNVGAATKGNPVVSLGKSEPGTNALAGTYACPSWQLNILCALTGPAVSNVGVVPTPPLGICIIHRCVEGSLDPVKITFLL